MVKKDLKKFETPVFPFTAIVGQEEMKLALQLNVIDPKIGGVMIMGDRGTGKSTTIRAIADLLPEIEVVKDDPFNSHQSDLDLMGNEVKLKKKKNESIETEFNRQWFVGNARSRACVTRFEFSPKCTETWCLAGSPLPSRTCLSCVGDASTDALKTHPNLGYRRCCFRSRCCFLVWPRQI